MSNIRKTFKNLKNQEGFKNMARTEQRDNQRISAKDARELLKDWDEDDKFKIYDEEIPEGVSYEWKRHSIRGMEDRSHQTKLKQMGYWAAVPGSRHPRFGFADDQPIIIDEMILMERAIELTNERKRRDNNKANGVVNDQMKALQMGDNGKLESCQTRVKRTMEIPD